MPDSEHDAALRYLTHLVERASAARTSSAVADVLTEIAAPVTGLRPLTREVVVRAWIAANDLLGAAPGQQPEPLARLANTANSLSQAALLILDARNHAADAPQPAPPPPPRTAQPSASRRH
ncbi:hypothetical protein AB0E85_20905 [Streptomyces sp. NPDC029044]|uniref:hypothetical protein n=1 Tax=Streptomyces sp. NPDC029044 TaxID=3157198 RepID=UPI0033EB765E